MAEYYLHHRLSEDLDFFSETEIDKIWLNALAKEMSRIVKAEKKDIQESFHRNLIFFTLDKKIIKTEFTYFPFPQIEKCRVISGISVDSLMDIAVNKFFTIYQKPSARHFIDLYLVLMKEKIHWKELQKLARIKFDTHIDLIQLGSQLVKAETIMDLPRMIMKLPEKTWRSYFITKAKELKSKIAK